LQFVPAAERWEVNANLVELGLQENARIIQRNSSSWTQDTSQQRDRQEKTATQIQAEVASMSTLVSAGLTQAYQYQNFEYYEIVRRFMRPNSKDPDVREARAAMLRQGVPEKMLLPEAWECDPERVMSPNKSMEMAIANWLMEHRDKYDPEPQREILRDVTLAVTDDPAKADRLVPDQPHISDSVHDAQLSFGALMTGAPVAVRPGLNELEVVPTLLGSMAAVMQRIDATGGMATKEEVVGLSNVAQNVAGHIQILARDKSQKAIVKQFGDQLGKLNNLLKGYAQRLAEQQSKQNGNGLDPETAAKIQSIVLQAQTKAQNTKLSHAQRTAQRQVQFEAEQKRKDTETAAQIQRDNAKTAAEIVHNRMRSVEE
jgi:hypothetical protein